MRAAVFDGPRSIKVADRLDPVIQTPTDDVIRVVLACVCGSDLWYYRGESPHTLGPIGRVFVSMVERIGLDVHGLAEGELVVVPFKYSKYSDGTGASGNL